MSPYKCSLLVVDDEVHILNTLSALLAGDFEVLTAGSAAAAQQVFAERPIDIILTDQRMPQLSGVELLEWVRAHSLRTMRLLMTAHADLQDAVEAINRGQVHRYLSKPWRTDELLEVLRSVSQHFLLERRNRELLSELQRVNCELQLTNAELEERVRLRTCELEEKNRLLEQRNQMLEKLALTDPLTGLPNRRALDRVAESETRRRTRYPSPLALGLVDIDHFKSINDRYLYPGGDQVLIDLGRTLTASVRTVDTVGRLGGEEFLVVAPETSLEGATSLAERIRAAVQETRFSYQDQPIEVTVSVGMVVAHLEKAADYHQLKHAAAAALAQAKAGGRNRCVIHSIS
jgi:diguanylate cyclase